MNETAQALAVVVGEIHEPKFTEHHHSPQPDFEGKPWATTGCLFEWRQEPRAPLRDS
jgi:hypothetical protein